MIWEIDLKNIIHTHLHDELGTCMCWDKGFTEPQKCSGEN